MPLYDYDCAECGRRVEVFHGVHAPGPTHCPNCGGGPLRKAISAPAVHFKGSGWAKKERRATVAPGVSNSGDSSSPGDGESKNADSSGTDGNGKDVAASLGADSKDKAGHRNGGDERAVGSPKPAAAGTATKTD
jgi:putative FmdB family regulatory protein